MQLKPVDVKTLRRPFNQYRNVAALARGRDRHENGSGPAVVLRINPEETEAFHPRDSCRPGQKFTMGFWAVLTDLTCRACGKSVRHLKTA